MLFELAGASAAAPCLYELTRIHGSCRDTSTNLALDFNIVLDGSSNGSGAQSGAVFEVPRAAAPRKLGELLAVSGGPLGGDWRWSESAVQLGATVVQSQKGGAPRAIEKQFQTRCKTYVR